MLLVYMNLNRGIDCQPLLESLMSTFERREAHIDTEEPI
jgi:hypothetical protein